MIVTSDEIRGYSPLLYVPYVKTNAPNREQINSVYAFLYSRNCYYNSERYLSLFKVYSETNCLVECLANATLKYCDCVFYHMPRMYGTKICALIRSTCITEAIENFQHESLLKTSSVDRCDCKPACTSVSFDSETIYSPVENIHSIYQQLGVTDTYE